LLAAAAMLALLFLANYTRASRINGWLLPQEEVVRVHAPRPGIVRQLDLQSARRLAGTLLDRELSARSPAKVVL
jgi:hypothetical protein